MSVEKLNDGLHSSGGDCPAGAVGSSANAAIKGKEIAKNKIKHASVFFLIADVLISFAPFFDGEIGTAFVELSVFVKAAKRKIDNCPAFLAKPQRSCR